MTRITASILVLVATAAIGCNQERNESIRLMNQGIKYYQMKKLSQAVDFFGQASLKDPKNHAALFYKGLIEYSKLGELAKGEQDLRKAIEIKADEAQYHYHLGLVLMGKEQWRQAVETLENAIKLREGHAESHIRLGMTFERLEKFDRAQEEYRRAVKLDPRKPEGYNALGNLYRRFDQFSHAVQVFKNGIENNPDWGRNYADLGVVYQALKRYDDAIDQFKKALTLDQGDAGIIFNLGMAYYNSDDRTAALRNLKMYLSHKGAAEDPIRIRVAENMIMRLEAGKTAQ